MTLPGAGKYKTYYCAKAKEKGPSGCTGFRGLRESVALPRSCRRSRTT
jgi:site-specific DNA recombinase